MKKRIMLYSHGDLAAGMYSSLNMLVGRAEEVSFRGLQPGEDPECLAAGAKEEILAHPDTTFYILADILGGSVSNALTRLTALPNVHVINGMNLSLVLGLHFADDEISPEDLDTILQDAKAGIMEAQIKASVAADDEEDEIV